MHNNTDIIEPLLPCFCPKEKGPVTNQHSSHTKYQCILNTRFYQNSRGNYQEKHLCQLPEVHRHCDISYLFVRQNHGTVYMVKRKRDDRQECKNHKHTVILIFHQRKSGESCNIHHRYLCTLCHRRRSMRKCQVGKSSNETDTRSAIHRQVRIIERFHPQQMDSYQTENPRSYPSDRTEHTYTRELLGRSVAHRNRTCQTLCRHVTKHRHYNKEHERRKILLLSSQQQENSR